MKAVLAFAIPLFLAGASSASRVTPAEDILAKSRDAYAKLQTYADQGNVITQYSQTYTRSEFRTYRRKPKDFFYEFKAIKSYDVNGSIPLFDHLVMWMRNGNLETWDGSQHNSYPAGVKDQTVPIANSGHTTHSELPIVASLLFQKAAIVNDLAEIQTISLVGTENVEGHKCFKLSGIAQSQYPSGKTFNVRPVTVWIDAQTYLLRRFFSDTPKGYGLGGISRFTITINPVANPVLSDANFQYKVPGA